MATERKENIYVEDGAGYEYKQRVVESAPSTNRLLISRIAKLLWLFATIIVVLVGFRFGLMLIGANPASGFAALVYGVTDLLVAPFMGITNTPAIEGAGIIDVPSLFAMAVYPLLTWGLIRLIRILFAEPRGVRRVSTMRREGQ